MILSVSIIINLVINYQTLKVREIFIGENKAESKMMDLTFI